MASRGDSSTEQAKAFKRRSSRRILHPAADREGDVNHLEEATVEAGHLHNDAKREKRGTEKRPSRPGPVEVQPQVESDKASDGDADGDGDGGGESSSVYDAKMDDGRTEQDLKVSASDPVAARSAAKVNRNRKQGEVEESVNMARVRLQNLDGGLEEVAGVDELEIPKGSRSVLYWMQREQRVEDNWPLLWAREVAEARGLSLLVVFCMVPKFLDATERQFGYLIKGMKEVEENLRRHSIPFSVLLGYAYEVLPRFVEENCVGVVVNDFNPLRCHREWVTKTAAILARRNVDVYRVDGHNTVPMWIASDKLETGARTIRGKIHRHLPTFLREYPPFTPPSSQSSVSLPDSVDWKAVDASLEIDRSVPQVDWIQPGEKAAKEQLQAFLEQRLKHFNTRRNDPTHYVLSNMSCYLHYGMISAARVVLQANTYRSRYGDAVASFVEEIVVRRELSDNFVWHEPNYDNFSAAKEWARQSLNAHRRDKREFLYTLGELECCVTYDELWNAAQLQLNVEGKMHGFLRMYWAKKVLEWTSSPEEAMQFAIFLNDKYELDGRDPNGYVGIAWSILGIHDQGWAERSVFGKIRYMNYKGCQRKFNVDAFVNRYPDAKVGSPGFKTNQQQAKELNEQRSRQRGPGYRGLGIATGGTSGSGPTTKRTHPVEREDDKHFQDDDNKVDCEDEADGLGGRQPHSADEAEAVEERKELAIEESRKPAGRRKRVRREVAL